MFDNTWYNIVQKVVVRVNCIDLFAGAGGLSEGFNRLGFNIIAHVEKEFQACLTLKTRIAYHYLESNDNLEVYYDYLRDKISRDELYSKIPNEILNTVINEMISEETIPHIFETVDNLIDCREIDLIIGGPPCQAYSLVGRARDPKSMDGDERKYLYKYYLKFLERYKPKMFVFENVKGILSANKGELFKQICMEMNNVGYKIEHRLLNAADFGVLQKRERVILVGWRKELDLGYPIFDVADRQYTIKALLNDLPKLQQNSQGSMRKYRKVKDTCPRDLGLKDDRLKFVIQHDSRMHNDRDLQIYEIAVEKFNKGERLQYKDLPSNLITHKNTRVFNDRFKVVNGKGLCHTLVAHIAKDGHHYIHPDIHQNRSLTVREAARIQTFPDDYYFESSRTAAYTQIGNAVPPLMAEKIAEKIKEILE